MRRHVLIASASLAIVTPLLFVAGPSAGLRAVPIGPLPPEPPPVSLRQVGDGRDEVCDGRRLPVFERRVLAAQAFRQDFSLPANRAYVERSLRDSSFKAVEGFDAPLSPAERRYMRKRAYFDPRRVTRYVHRNARDVLGGISIGDDYPGGPFAAVHLTGDFERHAEALGRLPVRSRVVPVLFTEAELDRKHDEVSRDFDVLASEGIEIVSVGKDISGNAVHVEVTARRPDAAAVVEQRFGSAVRAELIGPSFYRDVCVSANRYRTGRSGRTLRVQWENFRAFRFARLEVRETDRTVSVGVIVRAPFAYTLLGAVRTRIATLSAPLGNRRVIDGETGWRLRKLRRQSRR